MNGSDTRGPSGLSLGPVVAHGATPAPFSLGVRAAVEFAGDGWRDCVSYRLRSLARSSDARDFGQMKFAVANGLRWGPAIRNAVILMEAAGGDL